MRQIREEKAVARAKRQIFVRHCTDILRHFKPASSSRCSRGGTGGGEGGRHAEGGKEERKETRGRPPAKEETRGRPSARRAADAHVDVRHHSQSRADMMAAEELELEAGANATGTTLLDDTHLPLQHQPAILQGGQLRSYQLEGLNWLARLYTSGISGVLADEMGLGKTVQTVAMIGYLQEYHNASGPHLVLAPKSTLNNWVREFDKWLPGCRMVLLQGNKTEREELMRERIQAGRFLDPSPPLHSAAVLRRSAPPQCSRAEDCRGYTSTRTRDHPRAYSRGRI